MLSRFTIWLYAIYGLVQGVVIVSSSEARWGSPGYAVIMQAPNAPDSWGWVGLCASLLTIGGSATRRFWVKNTGILLLSIWTGAFASGAWGAVLASPVAGPTGPTVYFAVAAAIAVLVLVDERRPDARHS